MQTRPNNGSNGGPSSHSHSAPSSKFQSYMDEDPDFGSSTSSSSSQASEHVQVDMPEDVPPEVTIVWRNLTVVSI